MGCSGGGFCIMPRGQERQRLVFSFTTVCLCKRGSLPPWRLSESEQLPLAPSAGLDQGPPALPSDQNLSHRSVVWDSSLNHSAPKFLSLVNEDGAGFSPQQCCESQSTASYEAVLFCSTGHKELQVNITLSFVSMVPNCCLQHFL